MIDTSPEGLVAMLRGKRFIVLTGAGVSTESGLPDYRGEGAPQRTPMTIERFLESEDARERYWTGAHLGWRLFSEVVPNEAHLAVGRMQRAGLVTSVVTQNVDELHEAGGASDVIHLHGRLSTVRCLRSGHVFDRTLVARWLDELNPWIEQPDAVALNPDGDVTPVGDDRMRVPACPDCGGILKPDVVFFGELVPKPVFARAQTAVDQAEAVLVAGSSLAVNSAVRVLNAARRRDLPVAIVNRGPTRWDARADVRVEGAAGEVLSELADALIA